MDLRRALKRRRKWRGKQIEARRWCVQKRSMKERSAKVEQNEEFVREGRTRGEISKVAIRNLKYHGGIVPKRN